MESSPSGKGLESSPLISSADASGGKTMSAVIYWAVFVIKLFKIAAKRYVKTVSQRLQREILSTEPVRKALRRVNL